MSVPPTPAVQEIEEGVQAKQEMVQGMEIGYHLHQTKII